MLGDLMYKETGLEPQELDCQTTYLDLENSDKEYIEMNDNYSAYIATLEL